jgi:hypothetical protein
MINHLHKLLVENRRVGSSAWLLKAAIDNPKCTIVASNTVEMEKLKLKYNALLENAPWYKKAIWAFEGRVIPTFITLQSLKQEGFKPTPIIVDNSAIIYNTLKK